MNYKHKFLTKNQIVRNNQKTAKKYIREVLSPKILEGIQNHVDANEIPLEDQLIGSTEVFYSVLAKVLKNQLSTIKKPSS